MAAMGQKETKVADLCSALQTLYRNVAPNGTLRKDGLRGAMKLSPTEPETLFLPRPGLDQNPEDHQMRNSYYWRIERIDIPDGTQVEARQIDLQDAS